MNTDKTPPSGRISLVFTDIENSTRMAMALGDAVYRDSMRKPHCERVRQAIAENDGFEVNTIGDAFFITFGSIDDALRCAAAIQQNLTYPSISARDAGGREWTVRVRIGVHAAEQELTPRPEAKHWGYTGNDLNFAARVESLARSGQILASQTARQQAGNRDESVWREWPSRRLKSFDQPETVWELLWDGKSRGEPGSRWVPEWFTGETNHYVERPELESAVLRMFGRNSSGGALSGGSSDTDSGEDPIRLITLHGPGGMGKTRLAIQCAIQAAAFFADGVFFVSLEDVSNTADAVAERIGLSIGRTGESARPNALCSALADKRVLLLLDNYESVDSDAVAQFLADLLAHTSHLRLLVTGRESLRLVDLEQIVSLHHGLDRQQSEELFINRARLKQGPDWEPTENDRAAIRRIIRLTDGVPLALELTAAWMARRTLLEIATELEQSLLGAVTATPGRRRGKSRRHDSLAGCIEWSWNLLADEERDAFVRLGLFVDRFDAETARNACHIAGAAARLDRLQDAALVRRTEVDGRSCYQMLTVIRAYAMERLHEHPEAESIRRTYASWYQDFAERHGGRTQSLTRASFDAMDRESRNALAAAQIAGDLRDNNLVSSLSENLGEYLLLRGRWSERERLSQLALDAAWASADMTVAARALNNLGNAFTPLGRHREAAELFQQSLEIYRKSGDREGEAESLNNLGVALRSLGRLDESEQFYRQSLQIYDQFPSHPGKALVLNNLGVVEERRGNLDVAISHFQESREIRQACGLRLLEARTLNNLGAVHLTQQNYHSALYCFEQAADVFHELGDRPGEARARCNQGVASLALAETETAEQNLLRSLALSRDLDDHVVALQCLKHLMVLCEAQGRFTSALQYARESYDAHKTTGDVTAVDALAETIRRLESLAAVQPHS